MTTAKVFMTGRSQAVRIPRQFRFDTREVLVRRSGDSLVLTPTGTRTWDEFFKRFTIPDFELDRTAAQESRPEPDFT
jgi:antitoxin VapB